MMEVVITLTTYILCKKFDLNDRNNVFDCSEIYDQALNMMNTNNMFMEGNII